jgi:hypothetical protein
MELQHELLASGRIILVMRVNLVSRGANKQACPAHAVRLVTRSSL